VISWAPGIISSSRTAPPVTCRRQPAQTSPIPRSRTTAFSGGIRRHRKTPILRPQSSFPFDTTEAEHDLRDLALAWQALAEDGIATAESHAETLLCSAAAKFPDDPEVLSALAYIEQKQGSIKPARDLYRRALAVDPGLIDAADNLGVIEAESGHVREAIELWQGAFRRAPGRSSIGMNLARSFCAVGRFDDARSYTLRVLEFNPDMGAAKNFLRSLNHTPPTCAD
jgi:tetratricopeptide (TPR) repeat protein